MEPGEKTKKGTRTRGIDWKRRKGKRGKREYFAKWEVQSTKQGEGWQI